MFSKTLLVALSLLTLTASSALGSPARSCPAPSTVTVVASSSASASASNIAVASSAVGSSTSSTSNTRKGKGSKGKGGAKGATTSSALSSTEAIVASTSSAASNIAVASSSTVLSATASATSSSTDGIGGTSKGGDKGAASSAVSSASVATASSTANTAAASSSAATATSASGSGSGDDPQTATTLAQAVIATGFALDGQQVPAAGQVASLTSTNNFINFCLTVNKPITNGQQIKTGSCNPAPMGVIAATTNMPSSKFLNPTNFGTMKANTAFTIQMAIQNIQTGNFVNAADNYYSAPQQVNSAGNIIGHSHVVIEQLSSLNQTTTTDPTKFAFFKGINGAAVNGIVTADVTAGLPAGSYRLASINAAANHQPVLVAVAQHGSLDDMVYFTVQ